MELLVSLSHGILRTIEPFGFCFFSSRVKLFWKRMFMFDRRIQMPSVKRAFVLETIQQQKKSKTVPKNVTDSVQSLFVFSFGFFFHFAHTHTQTHKQWMKNRDINQRLNNNNKNKIILLYHFIHRRFSSAAPRFSVESSAVLCCFFFNCISFVCFAFSLLAGCACAQQQQQPAMRTLRALTPVAQCGKLYRVVFLYFHCQS